MPAHHRHVAGVITHAVLLLVGRIVLLIDHDQAEIGVRQKQSRARADNDADFTIGDGAPGARPLARRQFGMPRGGPRTETGREAVEKLRGKRNLRHQDQALPAAADGVRHRLEIDLGLAGAGDAIEQRDRIAALGDDGLQRRGGGVLVGGEVCHNEIGIRRLRHRLGRQHYDLQRAFVDEPVDHAGADAGLARGLRLAAHHAVGEQRQHAPACAGQPFRRRAGQPHADALAFGAQMLAHAQAHAQHHAARAERVICHPIDEAAQLGLERREFELLLDVLEPVIEPRIGFFVLRPHHPGGFARPERHSDDVARGELKLRRRTIGIGPIQRDRHQHVNDPFGHVLIVRRFSPI